MNQVLRYASPDPEQFQEALSPVVGRFAIRPVKHGFDVSLNLLRDKRLALFTVRAPSLRVHMEPPHRFYGLNIPLGEAFKVREGGRDHVFTGDKAHVLRSDELFDLEAAHGCRVLATSFYSDQLEDYAAKLKASDRVLDQHHGSVISLATPSGSALLRAFANYWSEVRHGNAGFESVIAREEAEDKIITNFILTVLAGSPDTAGNTQAPGACAVAAVEDYLTAHLTEPVSRADLADVAGVSIRSLSRGFVKRWKTGPMGFLKARRLEAAYRELLGAEPAATTVTEVAIRYGFTHLGKFAIDYKQAFRESPSETLRH